MSGGDKCYEENQIGVKGRNGSWRDGAAVVGRQQEGLFDKETFEWKSEAKRI